MASLEHPSQKSDREVRIDVVPTASEAYIGRDHDPSGELVSLEADLASKIATHGGVEGVRKLRERAFDPKRPTT